MKKEIIVLTALMSASVSQAEMVGLSLTGETVDGVGGPTGRPITQLSIGDYAGFDSGNNIPLQTHIHNWEFELSGAANVTLHFFAGGGTCTANSAGADNCLANYVDYIATTPGAVAATTSTAGDYPAFNNFANIIMGPDMIIDSGDEPPIDGTNQLLTSDAWSYFALGGKGQSFELNGVSVQNGDTVFLESGLHNLEGSLSCETCLVLGAVEVSAVPVPAAAWLFGSAVIGLAGLGRKRRLN